jgi:hypothetical protein
MPRKSAAALSTITPIVDHRPPVPDDMPEAQATIWRAITNRLPHDWFRREHLEMLRAYCQHACIAQTLARQIEAFRPEWLAEDGGLERLDQLSRILDREHRLMLALARAMRLTHQAQYDPKVMGARARAQGGTFGYIGMDGERVALPPRGRHT